MACSGLQGRLNEMRQGASATEQALGERGLACCVHQWGAWAFPRRLPSETSRQQSPSSLWLGLTPSMAGMWGLAQPQRLGSDKGLAIKPILRRADKQASSPMAVQLILLSQHEEWAGGACLGRASPI